MTLTYIVLATLLGGLASVAIAASLTVHVLTRVVRHLVSLSTGVLLATALLHVLPEALESGADTHALLATLLAGMVALFLLEKADLYRHAHHHEGDGHDHPHHFDRQQAGRGGMAVLVGDSIHNFCDGILIAAAFVADTNLGLTTALAIILHEIPQEVGDTIVLFNSGLSRTRAVAYNALSSLTAVAGGVVGWLVVGQWDAWLPYLMVLAASSMLYVAVADLIPQLQQRLPLRETAAQVAWLLAGIALIVAVMRGLHAH